MTEEAETSKPYSLDTLPRLNPYYCPGFTTPVRIEVFNEDTLNAGLWLADDSRCQAPEDGNRNPLIVNFACHNKPGGGWLNGALAQEESICYRTSLWKTLRYSADKPLLRGTAVYSPYVIVMRDDLRSGHALPPGIYPLEGPPHVVSVISIAAISIAAIRNPYTQALEDHVAHCWLEVLRENEFSGGWWRKIHFTVFDPRGDGNYEIFSKNLQKATPERGPR
ncbi:hypothetical protein OQA88_9497 [Cercophora sp. LCS_1]